MNPRRKPDPSRARLPEPTSARITDDVDVPGVDMIHGVTFDGTHVWFAGGPDQDLFCVDPASGRVVRRLGRRDCGAGLAFDGEHLWAVCEEGKRERIDRIDRANGKTLRSIPLHDDHPSGLAFAAGFLWLGSYRNRRILKIDPRDGRVVKTIASDRLVTGVTWVDGELWHGTYPERDEDVEPGELRAIDAETGAVKRRVQLPAGTRISGTEWDGGEKIWLGSRAAKESLRAIRRPSRGA